MALHLPRIKGAQSITLTPAENGGWAITVPSLFIGAPPETIGAFSTTADMMAALMATLMPLGEEDKPA